MHRPAHTLALLIASPQLVREFWSTSRFNLVSEYLGEAGMKTVHLRLFRRGVFTIRLQLHRPAGECGLVGTGTIGTWQRDGTHLTLRTGRESAVFDVIHDALTETLRQFAGWFIHSASDGANDSQVTSRTRHGSFARQAIVSGKRIIQAEHLFFRSPRK